MNSLIKVSEFLDRVSEYNTVNLCMYDSEKSTFDDEDVIATYDGRNSIDPQYNNYVVKDFMILGTSVILFVVIY